MITMWLLMGLVLWFGVFAPGRDYGAFALAAPRGWTGLTAWAIAVLSTAPFLIYLFRLRRNPVLCQQVREAIKTAGGYPLIVARNRKEFHQFLGVGFTAGVTEEIIFRGYLLFILATIMPLWAALFLALIAFVLPHAYQGVGGMVQVSVLGVVLSGIVLLGGSVWPAVFLHIAIDGLGALINWTLVQSEQSESNALAVP